MDIETKHYGKVRGGANEYARLFLHILVPDIQPEEAEAVFSRWDEEMGMSSYDWQGRVYTFNTRREFALLPLLMRRAEKLGYDLAISQWDAGVQGLVKQSEQPSLFWKLVALAQMWVKE